MSKILTRKLWIFFLENLDPPYIFMEIYPGDMNAWLKQKELTPKKYVSITGYIASE